MMGRVAVLLAAAVLLPERADAAFGYTTSSSAYTIDSGAGLVFQIRRVDGGSTTSVGDIMSLKYNGVEYQVASRGSHVDSGFDWIYNDYTSPSLSIGYDNGHIKVTVTVGGLTHYYIVRQNLNRIYMGSHATTNTDRGEWRFIARLKPDLVPNSPEESDISTDGLSVIESADVYGFSGGETRSKHYSGRQLKKWEYLGVTGSNVGWWIVRDNGEGMSGGPFYRVIQNQKTGSTMDLTLYWSYGMAQTEPFRIGRLNRYTLVVTDGSAPPAPLDLSFMSSMSLTGYVGSSLRGRVTCNGLQGRGTKYPYTVGFAKDKAQYWFAPYDSAGRFNAPDMIQGTYTLTVYKNELEVLVKENVEVVGGQTLILNTMTISNDPSTDTAIWRIGDWDGTPVELLNGDKVTLMHPSDSRMSDWNAPDYVVGSSVARNFPAYLIGGINNGHVVRFKLTQSQIGSSHVVRIGTTVSYSGARPRIDLNSWSGSTPAAPTQAKTRSLTVGTYRGNNHMYETTVPASAFKTDPNEENVLTIWATSGSSGSNWLAPSMSIDCVDLL